MANLSKEDTAKIDNAKKKYAEAQAKGDKAGMESAHREAESVRAGYGYSGGADGSQNISLGNQEPDWTGNGGKSSRNSNSNNSTSSFTYQDDLERLKRLQQKATANELKAQKEKTLQALAEQEATVKPTYQNQRNLASSNSQKGARSFSEYLASRGLTNSGAAAQGEMNRLSTLQNNLGIIDTNETNTLNEIARARANAESDYASNLATANSKIEAEYFNNLLQENQRQRLIDEQLKQQSMQQYANDYQAQINSLLAQGYSPNSREVLQLSALRGDKIANNINNATNPSNALASIQAGNINYNNAAALGWTVEQANQYYNNYLAMQQAEAEKEARQQEFENWVKRQQLANDTAQTQYNINKPYSQSTGNANTTKLSTYSDIIDNNYLSEGSFLADSEKLLDYIQSENESGRMSDNDALSLMALYGIGPYTDVKNQNTVDSSKTKKKQNATLMPRNVQNQLRG